MDTTRYPSDYISHALAERGWSQNKLARTSGIPQATISALVAGHHGVSPQVAAKLEKALGIAIETWLVAQAELDLARKLAKAHGTEEEPMAYAVDKKRNVLVEAPASAIDKSRYLRPAGRIEAYNWVKYGGRHETKLRVGEDGRVRRKRDV